MVEEITKERLQRKVGDRRNSAFVEDFSIPEKFRARLKDYFRSGYDRGHLVDTPLFFGVSDGRSLQQMQRFLKNL